MKRSDIIKIIHEAIHRYVPWRDKNHAEFVLKAIEEAGMLPPMTAVQKKRNNETIFNDDLVQVNSLYWEPEDD
jgi:hypothetical protein